MDTANRVSWRRQFRIDIGTVSGFCQYAADAVAKAFGAPFRQGSRADAENEEAGDEITREEERQLAQMVASLDRLFPFVRPSPAFRARLKEALLAEQRRRLAHRVAAPAAREGGISWRWSLAATVPLLVGVLATILWRRSHRSSGQLISPIGGP